MDAQTIPARQMESHGDSWTLAGLLRVIAGATGGMLTFGAILVAVRRARGALVMPLPGGALAIGGVILALTALLVRRQLGGPAYWPNRKLAWAVRLAPSAVLVLWAAGLSVAGSSPAGLLALWATVLGEAAWSWSASWRRPIATRQLLDSPFDEAPAKLKVAPLDIVEESNEPLDEAISQQIVRRLDGDSEFVEGWLRSPLAAGQRHATAHIAICPPLDRQPECFAEQLDGPPAQIKIGQALPYGVRFEIKLDKPAPQASSVVVEFSIQSQLRAVASGIDS